MAQFRRAFLILLVVLISVLFLWMIRTFLVTILLAALFSGVAYGLHRQLAQWLGGRERVAAALTLLILLALVVTPMLFVAAAVANDSPAEIMPSPPEPAMPIIKSLLIVSLSAIRKVLDVV